MQSPTILNKSKLTKRTVIGRFMEILNFCMCLPVGRR